MKDNRTAIIWRKSIYENDYKCKCGMTLYANGKVSDDVLVSDNSLYCPICGWCVAKLTTIEVAYRLQAMRCEQ